MLGQYQLTVSATFSAAHYLPKHGGACSHLHGHTWRIEATFLFNEDEINPETGMGRDFHDLKEQVKAILPDHGFLNEIYDFTPTAENLARHFSAQLGWATIKLWESEDAYVVYTPGR